MIIRHAVWILLCASAGAMAQEGVDVLDPDSKPRRILYAHLLKESATLFEARNRAVAALKSPDDLRQRQKELKARFLKALGPLPEPAP